ncbi:MAG: helix-turn-helix transcriptional regulator [Desulfuromonadales bacterium]|nr:helix-turn-helix transcriptional regulator [Desulfuromonadales bacterium]
MRRRRLELGLYQKDVAAQIGVTVSTIWNWEHGWAVGYQSLSKLIRFLGYSLDICQDSKCNTSDF